MDVVLENLDANNLLTVPGPTVTLSINDAGQASVKVLVTLDANTHVAYPGKSGGATQSKKTLATGVHPCAVLIVAHDTGGGRSYDTTFKVNGTVVARASGSIPEGHNDDTGFELIQLRVA